jgi:hypothetical protein
MATRRANIAKEERRKLGLFPSRDVDVPTALHLFEWSHYRFARSTEALGAKAITAVLEALQRAWPDDARVRFLRAAVDDAALETTWRPAVNALKQFQAEYSWGSKEKRQQLTAIAKEPRLLGALQVATVACASVPLEFLAVLVLDGSEASTDAVLPHFDRATKDAVRLDALRPIATFARGKPQYASMLSHLDDAAAARAAKSPVLELAKRLGVAGSGRFRVGVRFEGTPRANVWGDVNLDSAAARDFSVWVSTGVGPGVSVTRVTTLGVDRDDLGLGGCQLTELPAWLARAAGELGLRWNRVTARASHLRGKRLDAFLAWLLPP